MVGQVHSLRRSEPACAAAHASGESGSALQVQGETLQPPRPLPWYPDKLAWHMTFSREQLRNNPKLNEVIACMTTSAESLHWLHDLVRQTVKACLACTPVAIPTIVSLTLKRLVVCATRASPRLRKAQRCAQMHCGLNSPSAACTAQVHKLVIAENEAGAITRQEAVSMIPPLLLDVQPHHRVGPRCSRLADLHTEGGGGAPHPPSPCIVKYHPDWIRMMYPQCWPIDLAGQYTIKQTFHCCSQHSTVLAPHIKSANTGAVPLKHRGA